MHTLQAMRINSAYSLLCVLSGFLTACSNPDSEGTAKKPGPVISTDINEVNVRVFARSSWQDATFKVKAGDRLTIKPSGTWTGGQVKFNSNSETAEAMFCDANGCNGDSAKTFWANPTGSANPYRFVEEPAAGGSSGANTNKIFFHDFYNQNIFQNSADNFAMQKAGFGGVDALGLPLLDGKIVCFSNDNTFLGASNVTAVVLKTGWWYQRRQEWSYFRDLIQKGAELQRGSTVEFNANVTNVLSQLNDLIFLYANATCEVPPQNIMDAGVSRMKRILGALDDLGVMHSEHAYKPIYLVDVPAGNYGLLCRSDRNSIQSYVYGKPSNIIPKNDCAPANKNVLIMKIVGETEKFEDNTPIVVGKTYETSEYAVQKDGWIFLKNNDADTGIFDNGTLDTSFIDVRIKRVDPSQ